MSKVSTRSSGWLRYCVAVSAVLALFLIPLNDSRGDYLFESQIVFDDQIVVWNRVNDILKWEDLFNGDTLKHLWPGYLPDSGVRASVGLRGIDAVLTFERDSKTLSLKIPVFDVDLEFKGKDRDESVNLMKDWLRGDADPELVSATDDLKLIAANAALRRVLKGVVKYSPVEPVAGNPGSLQTRMTVADFRRTTDGRFLQGPDAPHKFSEVGASYFSSSNGPHRVTGVEIDWNAGWNIGESKFAVILDTPATLTWTEATAESLMFSVGAGLQYRVTDRWAISAMGRGGAVGSIEVGALGLLYSANITSYTQWNLWDTTIGWGLMAGVNSSIDTLRISGYEIEYHLSNYPVKTGLDWTIPIKSYANNRRLDWQVFGSYLRFFGDRLYVQEQGEVGMAFRLVHEKERNDWNAVRLSFGYTFGRAYDGSTIGLSYEF